MFKYLGIATCLLTALLLGCTTTEPADAAQPRTGTALVQLPGESQAQETTYEIQDGLAIFQEDIILGKVDASGKLDSPLTTQGFSNPIISGIRWSKGVIHYTIRSDIPDWLVSRIEEAMEEYERYTNITFEKRTYQQDYVEFYKDSRKNCASAIGRTGGKQGIRIGEDGCAVVTMVHEIGHAIGLHHEHMRPDRDDYIRINWDFQGDSDRRTDKDNWVIREDFRMMGEYDYASVMHYINYYDEETDQWKFSGPHSPFDESPFDEPADEVRKSSACDQVYSCFSEGDIETIAVLYGPKEQTWPLGQLPLYRWYSPSYTNHYMTTDARGRQATEADYEYQKVVALIRPEPSSYSPAALYEHYNPVTKNHFYSVDETEGEEYGYENRGLLGYVNNYGVGGREPVYRFYNSTEIDHFFTSDRSEGEALPGYVYEKIAFYTTVLSD